MRVFRFWVLWILLGLVNPWASAAPDANPLKLTAEEQAWIHHHPVLRVAVGAYSVPIEYIQGGTLHGLSAEYLATISLKTGLKFVYVETETAEQRTNLLRQNQVDLISSVRSAGTLPQADGVSYTTPYYSGATIIVTRSKEPVVFDIEDLNGKVIALSSASALSAIIHRRAPQSQVVTGRSTEEALEMVADGTADVTLGSEASLIPYLQHQYLDMLQISGVATGLMSNISMAVSSDQPVLYSILQKSLAAITASQANDIRTSWLATTEHGALSLSVVAGYYAHELALISLAIVLLIGLTWQANRLHKQAIRSEREKTMFLAVMSHEIRSPMNSVLAAVELLRYTSLDQRQQHFVDLANAGANMLLRLLDNVLDITRLEAGQLKLMPGPVDVQTLVNDVADLHQLRASEKGIALTTEIQPAIGVLMLDESRLAQVLHNLVSNAIKFTSTGEVKIEVSATDSDDGKHKHLEIKVIDTGGGISEAVQATLFKPYSQADQSYRTSGGTGLGLVICRELVTLMHGTVAMHSAVGRGTTVTVSLRAAIAVELDQLSAAQAQAPLTSAHASSTANPSAHVLIVEDTPANQEVLAAQVTRLGCQATVAQDGATAMAEFTAHTFDLILMDCHLQDMDGYTLAAAMRNLETERKRERCPIVAISASTGSAHTERCFAAGMDGVLSKPIRLAKLEDVISLWCGVEATPFPETQPDHTDFDAEKIRRLMGDDVTALLEAIVLGEADLAARAAHRIHGAALTLGWEQMAEMGEQLDHLLRTGEYFDDEEFSASVLREFVRCWREVDRADSKEVRIFHS
ncbi:ATP-binding protein [Paraburkholderia acidicola]|uniref:histidine kinase n=1 Tax=Paraburkholderia acidicola TaxID=1912599 RepID=A0ABV1LSY8_9BURK